MNAKGEGVGGWKEDGQVGVEKVVGERVVEMEEGLVGWRED